MRQRGSDRLLIVGFIALAVGSVALKAAAGPARDGFSDPDPGQIAERFESTLRSQNFVAVADAHDIQHSNVLARRGNCRLSVRDGRGAESSESLFARDASSIGEIRYLYDGRAYTSVPSVVIRFGRVKSDLLGRLGLTTTAPLPVALATSPDCGANTFGLDRVRIPI